MSRQILYIPLPPAALGSANRWNLPGGGGTWNSTSIDQDTLIVPCAGRYLNLYIRSNGPLGVGKNATFALMQNGSASALSTTIIGVASGIQEGTDQSDVITVAAGDRLSLQYSTTAAPSSISYRGAIEFESTNPGDTIHGGCSASTMGINGTFITQALDGPDAATWGQGSFIDGNHHSIAGTPGTITSLYCRLDGTIVSGSYTFRLLKNGVVQDGSGATVNTTVTVTSQTGNATFSLPVSAGDDIQIQVTVSSPSTARRVQYGLCFNASSPGKFNLCFSGGGTNSASLVTSPFIGPQGAGDNGVAVNNWVTPVGGEAALSSLTNIQFSALYALLSGAPGGGTQHTLQLRFYADVGTGSGVDQASSAVTIKNSATTGNATFSPLIVGLGPAGFSVTDTPSGTPAASRVSYGLEATADVVLSPTQMAIFPLPPQPIFISHKDFLAAPIQTPSPPVIPTQPLVWYPDVVSAAARGQLSFGVVPLTATLPAPPAVPTIPLAKFPDQIWSSTLLGAQFGPFYAGQSLPASEVQPPPLAWAPQVPDQVFRSTLLDGRFGPFFAAHSFPDPTLIPKIWAGAQPTYPSRHVYRRPVNTGGSFGTAWIPPAQPVTTLSWLAQYPDQIWQKTLPTADYPFWFGGQLRLAVPADTTLAWLPVYPDRPVRLARHPSLEPASVLDPRAGLIPPALSWKGVFNDRVDQVARLRTAQQQFFAFHPNPVPGPLPPGHGHHGKPFPDRFFPEHSFHPALQQTIGRTPFPLPNPTPPAQLSWQPRYPDQIYRPQTPPWYQVTQKPTQFEAILPAVQLRWWPRYPDLLLLPWRPVILPVEAREPVVIPSLLPATMLWYPVYPVSTARGRIILTTGLVEPIVQPRPPTIPICIEIEDELNGTPDFTPELGTISRLIHEFGGEADMDGEISCGPTEIR